MFSSRISTSNALTIVLIGIFIDGLYAREPSRIVEGSDAQKGEFPYQVSLRAYDVHLCGGAIISNRHILTAAHCIVGVTEHPYSEMTVVTGTNSLAPGTGKAYRVKDVKVHEKYEPLTRTKSIKNDIAVVSLRKEIVFDDFQKLIVLPKSEIPDGVIGVVTGFGRMGYPVGESAEILQKLAVVVYTSSNECLNRGVRVQRNQYCAYKSETSGVRKGDSGGPLVYNQEIVGVVSQSVKISLGYPDTYTRVFPYLDFIKTAMARI